MDIQAKNDSSEPAYPLSYSAGDGMYTGLTKRQKIAAMILAGMYGDPNRIGTVRGYARKAVETADTLLHTLATIEPGELGPKEEHGQV